MAASVPFVRGNWYLGKAFNNKLANKESGWVANMRHLLDPYGMSILILNIFKVLKDEVYKKKYNYKYKFFQKRAKEYFIETLLSTYENKKNNFFWQRKELFNKERYPNLNNLTIAMS